MNKIGVMADCSSGVEYAPFKNNVKICRTTIHFGEEELIDGKDITADEFYEKLRGSEIVPSTSAPTLGEIGDRIDEFKKEGINDVILFTISEGLSTYCQNVEQVKDEFYEGTNLYVVNSNTACLMEGYQAHYAEILAEKGYEIEDILKEVEVLRRNTNAYFVVDDLKYLVKNGRLSGFSGAIGTLINIKPILNLGANGKIETFEKVRTKKAAVSRSMDLIIEEAKNAKSVDYLVLHTGLKEEAEQLKTELASRVKNAHNIDVTTITPTVGAHIGTGIIGFARFILDDLKEEFK